MTTIEPAPRPRSRKPAFDKVAATWWLLVVLLSVGAGALVRMALPAADRRATTATFLNGALLNDAGAAMSPTPAGADQAATRPTIVVVRRAASAPVARTRAS